MSFGLHLYVIIIGSSGHFTTTSTTKASSASTASSEAILIKERGRRHALQQDDHQRRNIDSSQIPPANVEFIHPKLKDQMKDEDIDPENPFVWLTSYSRVPVSDSLG